MTGSDALLDTNAVVAWQESAFPLRRILMGYARPSIPIWVAGELQFGLLKSAPSYRSENEKSLQSVFNEFPLVLPTSNTHHLYASLRYRLRTIGRPIPEPDVWIAAMAKELGVPLITRDAHFGHIEGLAVISW